MKAVRVVRHGEPQDAIEVQEIAAEEPAAGQVRVQVLAASLNFGDLARCRGGVAAVVSAVPFTLGMDCCGIVEVAGPGMEQWIGQRVVGMTPQSLGGMADQAVLGTVFEAPWGLSDVEASAMLLPFHLGMLALHERARLTAEEVLLVRGAASAVGSAAVQLGVAAGARVIAVVGTSEKAALCRRLGAHEVLTPDDATVFDRVMDLTADRGVDVVFDPVGGAATEQYWTCGALGARYLAVGYNDDPESGMTGRPLRRLSMANATAMGVLLAYLDTPRSFRQLGINAFPPQTGARVHRELLQLFAEGTVRPLVGAVVDWQGVPARLSDHAARRTSGRSVAVPDLGEVRNTS